MRGNAPGRKMEVSWQVEVECCSRTIASLQLQQPASLQGVEISEETNAPGELEVGRNGLKDWVTGQVTLELAFILQPTSEKRLL